MHAPLIHLRLPISLRSVRRRSLPLAPLALIAFTVFVSCYGLNAGELYRNEGLRALIGAECLRGHWVVPTLYGEPILTKPPLAYWLVALVSAPFGQVTSWSARLPSAFAAVIATLLVHAHFRRTVGERAGWIAAGLLPLSFLWLDKVPSAEIDAINVAWVAAAVLFFLRALDEEEQGGRPLRWWLAAFACVAGGTLTKWAAPTFFYGTAVPLLLWRGRWRLLFSRNHLLAAVLAAVVVLSWLAAAIAEVGWEVVRDQVGREALNRLAPGHNGKAYPWATALTYPLQVWAAHLPISGLAFVGMLRLPKAQRLQSLGLTVQALHCWLWPNLLFWSILPEHSARNTFPLAPAFAGFAAFGILSLIENRPKPVGRALIGLAIAWIIVKLTFVHVIIPARTAGRGAEATGRQLAAAVPPGEMLYLFRLKDEGVMFYYGRRVRRLADPRHLPVTDRPRYCILNESELRQDEFAAAEPVVHLKDAQGDPIALVRMPRGGGP